jgi:hypothetical protein
MQYRFRLSAFLPVLLLTACGGGNAGQSAQNKKPQPGGGPEKPPMLRLSRMEGTREASLQFLDARDLLILRIQDSASSASAPPMLMADRLNAWKPLLEQLFQQQGRRKQYQLTIGEYPEMKGRMAYAAACSRDWDPRTGKPRAGDAGAAMRDMVNQQHLHREMESFFKDFGYRVSVRSAESVMICPWKEIPTGVSDAACSPRMQPTSQVPCGASIVFQLAAIEE